MKALRLAVTVLSGYVLAGCEGVVDAPIPADEAIAAPVAYAPPATESFTICSDPATTALSYDKLAWIPAFPTGPQYAPYGTAVPGSEWIGPFLNSGIVDTAPGTYYFRTVFTLPGDIKGATLSGLVHADNQATFFLNGDEFFQQAPVVAYTSFQDPADPFFTRQDLVEGTNVLRVQLVNGGNEPNPTALSFCFTVSYVPADGGNGGGNSGGCPAASELAAQYLLSVGIEPTSVEGQNVLALVADHMTKGSRFEGYHKCDAGYAPAVVAYVDALLP